MRMTSFSAPQIADIAARALRLELDATPKPGLVDRANSGAHSDMDYAAFCGSIEALRPYFLECANLSRRYTGAPEQLLEAARPLGIAAERDMLRATGGVNTHRGAIFSLGIACLALGRAETERELFTECAAIAAPALDDFSALEKRAAHSHGERQYLKYRARGIRGEAAAGFPSVEKLALPRLRGYLAQGASENDAGVCTLLYLIAEAEDTNMLKRAGREWTQRTQADLRAFLRTSPSIGQMLDKAAELDRAFIQANASPGGCADLLALAWFVQLIYSKRPLCA